MEIIQKVQTHTSFNTLEMKHHQRLEFIGDAVLEICECQVILPWSHSGLTALTSGCALPLREERTRITR